jgi:hypothetical protein
VSTAAPAVWIFFAAGLVAMQSPVAGPALILDVSEVDPTGECNSWGILGDRC